MLFYFLFYSFWGKFAQRSNLRKHAIIIDEAEFYRKLSNPTKKIVDWHILNEDMVQLEYEYQEEFTPKNMQTNRILATFTTTHAQLRLFNVLHRLGENGYTLTQTLSFTSHPQEKIFYPLVFIWEI